MAEITGIAWTDSTYNPWIGCTKVGPGCDHCYAEGVSKRMNVEWGAGAERRRTSLATRNAPMKWERLSGKFYAEHGRRRRVFCASLADVFDNEVSQDWRYEALDMMDATPNLNWQICTKRVSNIPKMVSHHWMVGMWPANVGILITTVTADEVRRDVPRLLDLKRTLGIPWVGLSMEPLLEDVSEAMLDVELEHVDWVILGGESGPKARVCHHLWLLQALSNAQVAGVSVFVKQLGSNCWRGGIPVETPHSKSGADMRDWPDYLRVQEFPGALR